MLFKLGGEQLNAPGGLQSRSLSRLYVGTLRSRLVTKYWSLWQHTRAKCSVINLTGTAASDFFYRSYSGWQDYKGQELQHVRFQIKNIDK
ncbi:hypothetical protein QF042_002506 [Pedobacter sp. W3I1]|nr:hypothetical protein [Pedobacter sp. W3I1]